MLEVERLSFQADPSCDGVQLDREEAAAAAAIVSPPKSGTDSSASRPASETNMDVDEIEKERKREREEGRIEKEGGEEEGSGAWTDRKYQKGPDGSKFPKPLLSPPEIKCSACLALHLVCIPTEHESCTYCHGLERDRRGGLCDRGIREREAREAVEAASGKIVAQFSRRAVPMPGLRRLIMGAHERGRLRGESSPSSLRHLMRISAVRSAFRRDLIVPRRRMAPASTAMKKGDLAKWIPDATGLSSSRVPSSTTLTARRERLICPVTMKRRRKRRIKLAGTEIGWQSNDAMIRFLHRATMICLCVY